MRTRYPHLRAAMLLAGMTVHDLAALSGISYPQLCRRMRGSVPFDFSDAARIMSVLHLPASDAAKYFFSTSDWKILEGGEDNA